MQVTNESDDHYYYYFIGFFTVKQIFDCFITIKDLIIYIYIYVYDSVHNNVFEFIYAYKNLILKK